MHCFYFFFDFSFLKRSSCFKIQIVFQLSKNFRIQIWKQHFRRFAIIMFVLINLRVNNSKINEHSIFEAITYWKTILFSKTHKKKFTKSTLKSKNNIRHCILLNEIITLNDSKKHTSFFFLDEKSLSWENSSLTKKMINLKILIDQNMKTHSMCESNSRKWQQQWKIVQKFVVNIATSCWNILSRLRIRTILKWRNIWKRIIVETKKIFFLNEQQKLTFIRVSRKIMHKIMHFWSSSEKKQNEFWKEIHAEDMKCSID